MELFRLENSSKTNESNHSPTTTLCPQAPRPLLNPPRDGGGTLRCLRSDQDRDHLHPPVLAAAFPHSHPAAPVLTPRAAADPGAAGGLSPLPVPLHGSRAPSSTASGIGTGNRPGASPESRNHRIRSVGKVSKTTQSSCSPSRANATSKPVSPRAASTRLLKDKGERLTEGRDKLGIRKLSFRALSAWKCLALGWPCCSHIVIWK